MRFPILALLLPICLAEKPKEYDYNSDTEAMLQMVQDVYGRDSPYVFFRELATNAADAMKKLYDDILTENPKEALKLRDEMKVS